MCGGAAPEYHGQKFSLPLKFEGLCGSHHCAFGWVENGEEGKSKMIVSCGFLEEELRQCSKEEGVTMADSVETLGFDSRTRVENMGAKATARRKKCKDILAF